MSFSSPVEIFLFKNVSSEMLLAMKYFFMHSLVHGKILPVSLFL